MLYSGATDAIHPELLGDAVCDCRLLHARLSRAVRALRELPPGAVRGRHHSVRRHRPASERRIQDSDREGLDRSRRRRGQR